MQFTEAERANNMLMFPRWRCFIKGISVTHVIITLLPATESDVHLMTDPEEIERQILTTPIFPHQTDSTSEHLEYKRLEVEADEETSLSGNVSPVLRARAETQVNDYYPPLFGCCSFGMYRDLTFYYRGATT